MGKLGQLASSGYAADKGNGIYASSFQVVLVAAGMKPGSGPLSQDWRSSFVSRTFSRCGTVVGNHLLKAIFILV
jgi:hypothetical protein